MAAIELKNICKKFKNDNADTAFTRGKSLFGRIVRRDQSEIMDVQPEKFAIENLNLSIPDGKVVVVLGPSGCGKTTLLKMIAGIDQPDSGSVSYDGIDMHSTKTARRGIGMMFQQYALYPHLSTKNNIISYFFFKGKKPEADREAALKFSRTAELLGIDIRHLYEKKPLHLSGGEKQRVALGRCITRDPKVFLLDEPFSNIDHKLREAYRVHLKMLLRQFNITTVCVTHDQREALVLADIIVVMNDGHIEQQGMPDVLYNFPKNIFMADFLSWDDLTPSISLIDGSLVSKKYKGMMIGVRPCDIEVTNKKTTEGIIAVRVSGVRHIPAGGSSIINAHISDNSICARVRFNEKIKQGKVVKFKLKRYHVFDPQSGNRICTVPE